MKSNKLFLIFVFSVIVTFSCTNFSYAEETSVGTVSSIVGVISNQQEVYKQSFSRIDNFMSLPQKQRMLMRYNNKYAYTGAGQQVFSPTFIPEEKSGIWAKSYSLFEDVSIGNGSNVSNVGYGTIIGYDTDLKHFKNHWDGAITYHIAQTGSRENYDDVKSIDTLGDAGVTGALFKNNFFTALTVDVGGVNTSNTVGPGDERYNTFIAGVASKTGYNIEFKQGRYILQPSFVGTYTYENISYYKSASGKNNTIDPINAIQIIPGVKLIGNFEGGWQPYLSLSLIWNVMDSPAVHENGVLKQRIELAPYCEYGFGVQRKWNEKNIAFGQVMMRGGGRDGVSLYFGYRRSLGKK